MVKYITNKNGKKIKQSEKGDRIRVGQISYCLIVTDEQYKKWLLKIELLMNELKNELPEIRIHNLSHTTPKDMKEVINE